MTRENRASPERQPRVNLLNKMRSLFARYMEYMESPGDFFRDFRYEIAAFFLSALIFLLIFALPVFSDLPGHLSLLVGAANGSWAFPANPLYYLAVWTLSLFSTDLRLLQISAIAVLATAVALKVYITKRIMYDYLAMSSRHIGQPDRVPITAFMLAFVFSLPLATLIGGYFYLGQMPANVWHNSTTIFLMPVALLLFWTSYKQLVEPKNSRIWLISLLAVVSILIKPNFFFVFAIVYPLFLATRVGIGRKFWLNVLPMEIPGVLLLGVQYYWLAIYPGRFVAPGAIEQSGVKISLFSVWSHYSRSLPLSLLASFFFPLTYLYWRRLNENLLLRYAVMLVVASVAVFSIFSETGAREFDGNFFWQCTVCTYILFATLCMLLIEENLPNPKLRNLTKEDKAIVLAFLAHLIFGILYIGKMLVTRTYS